MKIKLMKKKIFAVTFFTKGTCSPNYRRFYVGGQQELCPFYMWIPYGNAFCADSLQALQVKNIFYVFNYDKISLKFCVRFRFFLAIFMEKFQKICYLSYVRRGINMIPIHSVVCNEKVRENNCSVMYAYVIFWTVSDHDNCWLVE